MALRTQPVESGITEAILESVGLAATRPTPPQAAPLAVAALDLGIRAFQRRCAIPLPVLLDFVYGIDTPPHDRRFKQVALGNGVVPDPLRDYDGWLDNLWRDLRSWVARTSVSLEDGDEALPHPELLGSVSQSGDWLEILIQAWRCLNAHEAPPDHEETTRTPLLLAHQRAFQHLRDFTEETTRGKVHVLLEHLIERWCRSDRKVDLAAWKRDIGPIKISDWTPGIKQALLWGAFQDRFVHERFDHHAAWFFLQAKEAELASHPLESLLQHERKDLHHEDPIVRTYEQAARMGALTLFTLVLEEYGEFLIVNQKDLRINRPPDHFPREPVHVYLCWFFSYQSVLRTMEERRAGTATAVPAQERPADTATLTGCSLLTAVTFLLLCDLLRIFRWWPVEFHLHRAFPDPWLQKIGRHLGRWQGETTEDVPPREFIREGFRRVTCVEMADTEDSTWHIEMPVGTGGSPYWFCGCVLRDDLPQLGLRWNGPDAVILAEGNGRLPKQMTHVVVVDDPWGHGHICCVDPAYDHGSIRLRRIPLRFPAPQSPDPSFANLRRQFAEVADLKVRSLLR